MSRNEFFKKINFNKPWNENDWEKYFQAHEAYRLITRNNEVRKIPIPKFKFEGEDEVKAFEPILREYGLETTPDVVYALRTEPFLADKNPEEEYTPEVLEDPHFWGEGAPLASLPIYRDSCRFAIVTANEIDRFVSRKREKPLQGLESELANLRFHAIWSAVNIAQGHQIGYSKDRILGNIAKVRRAINHMNFCISSINKLSQKTKSIRLRKELFSFAVQLRQAFFLWTDDLKERI